jgi:hypothetical protein
MFMGLYVLFPEASVLMAKRSRLYHDGNKDFVLVSVREIVREREFRAGFRAYLRDAQFPRFIDSWGYERGRLVAAWALANGRRPPGMPDTDQMVQLYQQAEDADAVL